MKTTVNFSGFCDAFNRMGRKDQFTYSGLRVLFDYFEQYEEDTGEEVEMDVIAICCEFNESTPDEIRADYSVSSDRDLMEYLQYHTLVAGVTDDGSIVYAAF
jgi:hypothetical protein